jgi:predicted Zn-dependent protease
MKNISKCALALVAVFACHQAVATEKQEGKDPDCRRSQEVKKDANTDFGSGNFDTALQQYKDLVKSDPQNTTYNFRLGFCYLRAHADKSKAAQYLEKESRQKTRPRKTIFTSASLTITTGNG